VLQEESLEHNNNVYVEFFIQVDYEKAFDKVIWQKLMRNIQNI